MTPYHYLLAKSLCSAITFAFVIPWFTGYDAQAYQFWAIMALTVPAYFLVGLLPAIVLKTFLWVSPV